MESQATPTTEAQKLDKAAEKRAALEAKIARIDQKARRDKNPAWPSFRIAKRELEKAAFELEQLGYTEKAKLLSGFLTDVEILVDVDGPAAPSTPA